MLSRRPTKPVLRRVAVAPPVVLACERCGFDYTITTMDLGPGQTGVLWQCACGVRLRAPGEGGASRFLRP